MHRIGKPYKIERSGSTVKPIISKFNAWRYRLVFSSESMRFLNSKKKPDENSFIASLGLTKRKYNLLRIA